MSGHNKWSQIKHKKAKEDAKKGKAFTKLIKEITVAARSGGGEQAHNPQLRHLLEEARAINMPLDNAIRAIKRGTGELPGTHYEPITYEGYGPHGVAIMIDTLSDNRNRTVAELRFIFSSHSGNLGESGSVGWMFEHAGVIQVSTATLQEDALLTLLLDHNIIDLRTYEDSYVIIVPAKAVDAIKSVLAAAHISIQKSGIEWIAKNTLSLSDAQENEVVELLSALQDHDDVQNVYSTLA